MYLDTRTLVFMAAAICLPIAALLFLSWWQNRAERMLLWWSGAFLASGVGLGLIVPRGHAPSFLSIDIANALMLVGVAMCWAGARAFSGRHTPVGALLLGASVWLISLHLPTVYENLAARVGIFAILYAGYTALASVEYWRGRADGLASRYMLAVSFAFLSVLYAGRLIISAVVPMQGPIEKAHPDLWMAIFFMTPIVVAVANSILVVAVTKERSEATQRHLAEIDPLTGLLNRGATLLRVAAGMSRGPGAMLVFDLDRFKQINDRNGHPAGDRVLKEFATVAERFLREEDIFGRIGGEEFLAFLPYADRVRAMAAAERIRSAFAEARIELNGVTIPATVSIGIAIADGDTRDIDPLLIEADRALYAAKENGRDRVQFFVPKAA